MREDANDVDIDNDFDDDDDIDDFDDDDTWREQALGALEDGGRGLHTRRGGSQAIPQAGSELVGLGLGFWKKKIKKKNWRILENCQNVRELVKHRTTFWC